MDKSNFFDRFRLVILIIVCAIILYFIVRYKMIFHHIRVRHLKNYILSYGRFSAIVFIIIYSIKPIAVFVPASLMSVLAGNIYGPWKALIISMLGCFGSATFGFYLARVLGKPFVDKIIKGKALKLDDEIEKHGFKVMLMMRLAVIFPYDALSFAGGLSKMKYTDFILASMMGILPEMISYSFMGENIQRPVSIRFMLPILLTGSIAIISYYIYKSYRKAKKIP